MRKLSTSLLKMALLVIVLWGCQEKEEVDNRPNILWLYVEDISPNLGCYGDENVQTPYVDEMAENGLLFTNMIMPAPVCSPTRSAIITGAMQTSLGIHNHHSSRTESSAIQLPDGVKTIPELFREQGYFTFNQGKDDYNFSYDRDSLYSGNYRNNGLYGFTGEKVDWSLKKDGQPYFGQIQLRGNKYIYAKDFKDQRLRTIDPDGLEIPPYYTQTDYMKQEWASYLEAIEITDKYVGEILGELEKKGLLDNTYVFFFSDHGMRLWRHKQFLYEGGLKVPCVLRYYGQKQQLEQGSVIDDLVSGIDIGITSLGFAGIGIPSHAEGQDIFAEDYSPREFVISARDRCDYTIDQIRSVRTVGYKYIKNFKTDRPYMQPNYKDEWEITQIMRKEYADGNLNEVQERFWKSERPEEELYDLVKDPDEIHNLALDPNYEAVMRRHRDILNDWIADTDDQGQYPEDEEGLKVMLGIWGERCINPEYDKLKAEQPELSGTLEDMKS